MGRKGAGLRVAIRREQPAVQRRPALDSKHSLQQSFIHQCRRHRPPAHMAHIGSRHTLQSLADVVGMSTRNLAQHFVSETGITPHEFVERARIDAARMLLRVATGLSNPSPMTAASARQTGCASCSASVWVSHPPIIAQTFEDPNHAAAAKLTRRALRHRKRSCLHAPRPCS